MSKIIFLFAAFILFSTNLFAEQLNLRGSVQTAEGGNFVENAVVLLKKNNNLIAYARTLSKSDGSFVLSESSVPIKLQTISPTNFADYLVMDLLGRAHKSLNNLPQGIYVLLGKTENGKNVNLGIVYHSGGKFKNRFSTENRSQKTLAKTVTSTGDEFRLLVRKAGYLEKEVQFSDFDEDVGAVTLKRDPLENRIDSVMALMDTDDKIYQMTQGQVGRLSTSYGTSAYLYGSLLHGGDGYSSTIISGQNLSSYNPKIPVTYGKDMMHGAAAISGATVFPHNIGMGATRDSALVRKACEVTAQESWVGGVDLIFGPSISVPQDDRWGRTYEGFGSTAELAVEMGAACIRGYQGEKYNADWRLIATAKHYLADGGVSRDRGNVTATDKEIREIHLPGYEAAVEQGVLSVMASFNQIRGVHQHIDSLRLTGWLKTELGFDGYIISDWLGIGNSLTPGATDANSYGGGGSTSQTAIKNAINAGIDLAMEPGTESTFISGLRNLVNSGQVSMNRIDDAVRRILRAKFRAGRMDNPAGISDYVKNKYGEIGSAEHRAIAREAVRKSLVLLKNETKTLPISKNDKVFVTGTHATNTGYQCGGWTLGWTTVPSSVPGATSIKDGFNEVVPGSVVNTAEDADVIVFVTGETPYAEWNGDKSNLTFSSSSLAGLKSDNPGKKIVTVFISGRVMEVSGIMDNSDAFVAAWLPGSEGSGIADVLFGDYNFTGKLPRKWDDTRNYGFGLEW